MIDKEAEFIAEVEKDQCCPLKSSLMQFLDPICNVSRAPDQRISSISGSQPGA